MSAENYMPQWRALVGARAILGDRAKVWKKDGKMFVGRKEDGAVVVRRGQPSLAVGVRIYGEGGNWPEALRAAREKVKS